MVENHAEEREGGPRIHVDEDWKERARREKEEHDRLHRERSEGQERSASGIPYEFLRPSFPVLVELLAANATAALAEKRLDAARFWVDVLGVLESKTRGNLEADEQKMLEGVLFHLRMACVELAGQLQRESQKSPTAGSGTVRTGSEPGPAS